MTGATGPADALAELSAVAGIARRYTDQTGQAHDTSDATRRVLLRAMGLLGEDEDAGSALARYRAETAGQHLPEWLVITAGDGATPLTAPNAGARWRLEREDGEVREGIADPGIALGPLPVGIHDLWLDRTKTTLLAAPPHLPRPPRSWGITLPLYGLRSAAQGGIGDYADLGSAVAELGGVGAAFVGINPIHAGFPGDPAAFSPYAPSSRRRFSTAHIAVGLPQDMRPAHDHGALIDHGAVMPQHWAALERAYAALSGDPAGFAEWRAAEGTSLERFAVHQALSEAFGPYWDAWPADLRDPGADAVAEFARDHAGRVRFHAWLQWVAEAQLDEVRQRADAKGMRFGLYLDLAVGTHPHGAETWAARGLFAQGVSLGAPPDAFSRDGQMWNLAPLEPRALAAAGFRPLAEILRTQLRFARLLRIDHILGFERAFWVPEDRGVPGAYVAMPKAALLAVARIEAARAGATIVGEDLGNIPQDLQTDLEASGILGCRVAMFEQDHDPAAPAFRPASVYPQNVLAAFATHDLPTWRGWRAGRDIRWRHDLGSIGPVQTRAAQQMRQREVAAFDRLAGTGDDAGTARGNADCLHAFLAGTPSRLIAVQIEDILGQEEQPNLPGTVYEHPNWRRRLPIPADALADDPRVRRVAAIMESAGRQGRDMDKITVKTAPIEGQKPGTSGLRKKTRVFMGPHYLENFVQAIWQGIGGVAGKTLVLGGDGRYFNDRAAQVILRMAAASGAARIIVGQNALLSTPAASHLIRARRTDGGIIMSASHNPGGADEDFGIKFNTPNGGPAPEEVTNRIFAATRTLESYQIVEAQDVDLSAPCITTLGGMEIEVVDPVADYRNLMAELFDFEKIRTLIADGFSLRFDAMHAVTGPYALAILEGDLGAPEGSVVNAVPKPDFGGGHPDPNPIWAKPLVDLMMSDKAPDFGAASDGDGDRNMILGRGVYVTPSDSLAILAANAHLAPGYAAGLKGVARSMPTSRALDRVAAARGLDCYETPTGWKFFGNLLDAGLATLCGEESAGTGSDHVREKDGLWAVLLWLNILAQTKLSVAELTARHWEEFGRNFYSRHDYEAVDAAQATAMIERLRNRLADMPETEVQGRRIVGADEFAYDDPVDGTRSEGQGIRILFDGGGRIVYRLSGTGTEGATLRVYLEDVSDDPTRFGEDTQVALAEMIAIADEIAGIETHTGRGAPDVRT